MFHSEQRWLEHELCVRRVAIKLGFGSPARVAELKRRLLDLDAQFVAERPILGEPPPRRPRPIHYVIALGMDEHLDDGRIYDDVSRNSRSND